VLAITDTQYYRVLLWAHHREAFSREASVVIGQPDLDSSGQNQYAFHPGARTLSWCYDSGFYQDGIWVADTGNSRLLWYSQIPGRSDTPANGLLGKPDFITGSENLDSVRGTENSLYWPFSLAISNRLMAVADTGNHRILLYHLHF
jgi:hypothetical protein